MTTIVLSSQTTSQQQVQILPRQKRTVFSNTDLSSFHPSLENVSFPKDIFDFEDLAQVDDLISDLGMNPPTTSIECDTMPSFGNSNDHTGNGVSDSHQALETNSSNYAEISPGNALSMPSVEASTFTNSGSVVRTVSFPSLPSSVPNPIQDFSRLEPYTTMSSTKAYTPLLPNPTSTSTKSKLATITATNKLTTTTANKFRSKATIAKSSSIPSLLPSDCLPERSPGTATGITARAQSGTTNVRKRKLSRKEVELNMSSEELEERRERNRSHAKKSRQRKKALTELLQESVQMLQEENQKLRQSLNAQMGPQHAERWWQGQKEMEKESFLRALKNPKNRIVDASGLAFLKKLQNRIPKHNNNNGEASESTARTSAH